MAETIVKEPVYIEKKSAIRTGIGVGAGLIAGIALGYCGANYAGLKKSNAELFLNEADRIKISVAEDVRRNFATVFSKNDKYSTLTGIQQWPQIMDYTKNSINSIGTNGKYDDHAEASFGCSGLIKQCVDKNVTNK